MAIRIKEATKEYLCSVPLPVFEDSYTVISHESVMDYTLAQLTQFGFNITSESFRCTADGNIAQGTYYLNYEGDEEIGMMFAWSNSYNKQMRFKCAIGGYVFVCLNGMICGDMGSWSRKHTGVADVETQKTIADQISNAHVYYDRLVSDKNIMKEFVIDSKRQAELLGVLFAEYEILTTEQMSLVKQQMDKPSYFYNGDVNSLWSFYNHVTLALKKSHPRNWMEDQRKLHWFLSMEFDLVNFQTIEIEDEAIDQLALNYGQPDNQTNILHQLADLEAEEMMEDFTYATMELEDLPTEIYIESDSEYAERVAKIEGEPEVFVNDEIVQYTDPAGNTFEVPVFETKMPQEIMDAFMNAPKIDASEIDMSKVTWVDAPVPTLEPTPEEYLIIEQELIEEEALFDIAKTETVSDINSDWDLSLDNEDDVKDSGEYFL